MSATVPGIGPHDAKLLLIGEAPGREEVRRGEPFVGATGQAVFGVFERAGLKRSQCRINNVIPYNPGTIHEGAKDRLVRDNWDNIAEDLACTQARVIVACGGVALRRLTGMTKIADEHGGVIPARDVKLDTIHSDTLVIPCLHPAGIMRSKLRAEWVQVAKVLDRAAQYALGKPYEPEIPYKNLEIRRNFTRAELDTVFQGSDAIAIDTEFDADSHVPFAIGVLGSAAPHTVFIWNPISGPAGYLEALREAAEVKLLVAHYHPAEVRSLAAAGCPMREHSDFFTPRWFDTMLAYSTLYPDTNVGLNHACLFALDNERNWKDMSTQDDAYLAKDVRNTYRLYLALREELAAHGMMQLFTDEVMPSLMLLEDMETVGIQVDSAEQSRLIAANEAEQRRLLDEVQREVASSAVRVKYSAAEMEDRVGKVRVPVACLVKAHAAYRGVRAKRWAAGDCCCQAVYDWVTEHVGRDYARAFDPGNNHDLRWLLYEHLELPVPPGARTAKAKKPSANIDTVQKLQQLLITNAGNKRSKYYREDSQKLCQLLDACKEYQHLSKVRSTFLEPPVDADGVAHPPYRLWGAGTGRIAGGGEGSKYSFNMLNVPKNCRSIFVPMEEV